MAAALTLLRHTRRRVLVVERGDYAGFRIGETVSPSLQPLLVYLGVWERFLGDGHWPALGTSAAWGGPGLSSREYLFTGRGNGWHLDRRRFDAMLAAAVRAAKARVLTGARLADCSRVADGRWQLAIVDRAGKRTACRAHFLVDATGRASALARRIGARRRCFDLLVGVAAVFAPPAAGPAMHHTLVESCAAGWWYSAPLPSGRTVVVLMTDSDLARALRAGRARDWRRLLAATRATAQGVAGRALALPPRILPASSQLLEPAAGPGWIAAGDAAVSFDPLAAIGIGHALTSGIHAARAAHEALAVGAPAGATLASPGALVAGHDEQLSRAMSRYLELRRSFYAIERRWPDEPFWARRQGPSPARHPPRPAATLAESRSRGSIPTLAQGRGGLESSGGHDEDLGLSIGDTEEVRNHLDTEDPGRCVRLGDGRRCLREICRRDPRPRDGLSG